LAAIEPSETALTSTDGTDDYAHVMLHEVTAYLSPLKLADKDKLSPLIFWKKSCGLLPEYDNVNPSVSHTLRVFSAC